MVHKRLIALALATIVTLTGCGVQNPDSSSVVVAQDDGTIWGIHMLLFPVPFGSDEKAKDQLPGLVDKQIDKMKRAGMTTVRIAAHEEELPFLDIVIPRLAAAGLRIKFIVDLDFARFDTPYAKNGTMEQHGYDLAKMYIDRYGKHITYYQLGNEIGEIAIKSGIYPGTKLSEYDPEKMDHILKFIQGISRAVADHDPGKKRIVNIHSKTTEIVAEAIRRGVEFEVLGWTWYSDFGLNLENPELYGGEKYPFLATLKGFHKELWITELGLRDGVKNGGEKAQADWLEEAIEIATESGFTAIFPYALLADMTLTPEYSFLTAGPDRSNVWRITGERQVYDRYREIIERASKDA